MLFIGGISYYIIDKIQEKNNLMDIEEYSPKSTLIVPETSIKRAKFPFIDVHNHQFDMPLKDLSKLTAEMDSLNMAFMINLSGFRGLYLQQSLKNVKENAPTRFGLFVNIDFETIDEADFATEQVALIDQAVQDGVMGLKVYKSLGLTARDKNGTRIAVNDPRLDPIWKACGDNNIPVLIHTGEPASFWHPKDKFNERWLELRQNPTGIAIPKPIPPLRKSLRNNTTSFRSTPTPLLSMRTWDGWEMI